MELRQEVEFVGSMHHLAEQHHVGQPLALYHLRPQWKRFLKFLSHFLLIITICAVLFVLVVFSIFGYQVMMHQIVDVQGRLMLSLPGTISGLLGCVECLFLRYALTHWFPDSILVCTEGFLVIAPDKIETTQWNEVHGFLKVPGFGRQKKYMLCRIHRRSLTLSNIYENFDELIHLVRQHIPQQCEW